MRFLLLLSLIAYVLTEMGGGWGDTGRDAQEAAANANKNSQSSLPSVNPQQAVDCVEKLKKLAKDKGLAKTKKKRSYSDNLHRKFIDEPYKKFGKREGNEPVTGFGKCLPLVSISPAANPYHDLLTGMKYEQIVSRKGFGPSMRLSEHSIDCTADTQPCPIALSQSITITTSLALSITTSSSNSKTFTNVTNWSQSASDSITKSITDSLDVSTNHQTSMEDRGSFAENVQSTLTKTHEESTSNTHTTSNERSIQNVKTWDHEEGRTENHEDGTEGSTTTGTDVTIGTNWETGKDGSTTTGTNIEDGWNKNTAKTTGVDKTDGWENGSDTDHSDENQESITGECSFSLSKESSIQGSVSGGLFGIGLSVTSTSSTTKGDTVSMSFTIGKTVRDGKTTRNSTSGSTLTHGSREDSDGTTHSTTTLNSITNGHHENQGGSQSTNYIDTTVVGHHRTNSYGRSWIDRTGGSESITNGHTESDSKETRIGDSLSEALTKGSTYEKGWSRGTTDSYGLSNSHTNGLSNEKGIVDNRGGEYSNANQMTTSTESQRTDTVTLSKTNEITFTDYVKPGTCGFLVCKPQVISVAVPWLCRTGPDSFDLVTTEVQEIQSFEIHGIDGQIRRAPDCTIKVDPCHEEPIDFLIGNQDYKFDPTKAIASGQYFTPESNPMRPTADGYLISFDQNNIFCVMHYDEIVWSTHTRPSGKTRVRITSEGHLIQESTNVYGDESIWSTIWSTIPNHLFHPVGIYGKVGYKLFLGKNGELELLDSSYVKIWSSNRRVSKNALGFKYPQTVTLPTTNPTEPNEPGQVDPHNDLPTDIIWRGSSLERNGDNCTMINEGEGLMSPNKRFKLYLTPRGNLIFKDGTRTMWESSTSSLWFAKDGGYKAYIGSDGSFQVKDTQDRLIWKTGSLTNGNKFSVEDNGNLVLYDKDKIVWNLINIDTNNLYPTIMTYYDFPVISIDTCRVAPIQLSIAPLVNILTGKCLNYNSTNSIGYYVMNRTYVRMKGCDPWTYNPARFSYTPFTEDDWHSKCLDGKNSTVKDCDKNNAWHHYSDGFLTGLNYQNLCLALNGSATRCDGNGIRVDKLWTHGPSIKESLNINDKMIMMGHVIYRNSTTVSINKYGDILFKHYPSGTIEKTFKIPGIATPVTPGPIVELRNDGSLVLTNVNDKILHTYVSGGRGTPPYRFGPKSPVVSVLSSLDNPKGSLDPEILARIKQLIGDAVPDFLPDALPTTPRPTAQASSTKYSEIKRAIQEFAKYKLSLNPDTRLNDDSIRNMERVGNMIYLNRVTDGYNIRMNEVGRFLDSLSEAGNPHGIVATYVLEPVAGLPGLRRIPILAFSQAQGNNVAANVVNEDGLSIADALDALVNNLFPDLGVTDDRTSFVLPLRVSQNAFKNKVPLKLIRFADTAVGYNIVVDQERASPTLVNQARNLVASRNEGVDLDTLSNEIYVAFLEVALGAVRAVFGPGGPNPTGEQQPIFQDIANMLTEHITARINGLNGNTNPEDPHVIVANALRELGLQAATLYGDCGGARRRKRGLCGVMNGLEDELDLSQGWSKAIKGNNNKKILLRGIFRQPLKDDEVNEMANRMLDSDMVDEDIISEEKNSNKLKGCSTKPCNRKNAKGLSSNLRNALAKLQARGDGKVNPATNFKNPSQDFIGEDIVKDAGDGKYGISIAINSLADSYTASDVKYAIGDIAAELDSVEANNDNFMEMDAVLNFHNTFATSPKGFAKLKNKLNTKQAFISHLQNIKDKTGTTNLDKYINNKDTSPESMQAAQDALQEYSDIDVRDTHASFIIANRIDLHQNIDGNSPNDVGHADIEASNYNDMNPGNEIYHGNDVLSSNARSSLLLHDTLRTYKSDTGDSDVLGNPDAKPDADGNYSPQDLIKGANNIGKVYDMLANKLSGMKIRNAFSRIKWNRIKNNIKKIVGESKRYLEKQPEVHIDDVANHNKLSNQSKNLDKRPVDTKGTEGKTISGMDTGSAVYSQKTIPKSSDSVDQPADIKIDNSKIKTGNVKNRFSSSKLFGKLLRNAMNNKVMHSGKGTN
ncbi:hypothetical protein HK099_000284 [Clydaea vesicula]|uniref:Bulb-type lectin domain-containing protein n=1 Tax=Clydaea vesicula TaxID=447962 RepID=A0AAD5U4K0_9FUNG|nr:hypothetical protein HK099_000284 [Clydaea vesicula]